MVESGPVILSVPSNAQDMYDKQRVRPTLVECFEMVVTNKGNLYVNEYNEILFQFG